jgi:hypothetical protein
MRDRVEVEKGIMAVEVKSEVVRGRPDIIPLYGAILHFVILRSWRLGNHTDLALRWYPCRDWNPGTQLRKHLVSTTTLQIKILVSFLCIDCEASVCHFHSVDCVQAGSWIMDFTLNLCIISNNLLFGQLVSKRENPPHQAVFPPILKLKSGFQVN